MQPIRNEVLKRIQRKRNELFDLYERQETIHTQITAIEQVISELESLLKLMPDEESGDPVEVNLRPNSAMAQARDALRKLRKPTHIDELLKAMGQPADKKRSLTGQLSLYARKGQIFSRPQPNTFGLLEWASKEKPDGTASSNGKVVAGDIEDLAAAI